MAQEIILTEQSYSFSVNSNTGLYYATLTEDFVEITPNTTYCVVWDGVEWNCVATECALGDETGVALGNLGLLGLGETTEETFVIGFGDSGSVVCYTSEQLDSHDIYIYLETQSGIVIKDPLGRSVTYGEYNQICLTRANGEKTIYTAGTGGIAQVQADYLQNDSTATDYIKNRPFYESEPIPTEFPLYGTVLEKQTLDRFALDSSLNAYVVGQFDWFSIQEGENYIVHWDGTDYPVTAYATVANGYDTIALGNEKLMKGESTEIEEPFVVASVTANGYRMIVAVADTESTPHTVAIYSDPPIFTYTEGDGSFIANGTPSAEMLALWKSDWESCVFTWDGVEYACEPQTVQGIKCIGNVDVMMGTGDGGEPFVMMCADAALFGADVWVIYDLATEITDTTEEGATTTHEVGLVINALNITKLDPKYLENIDYETQLINKPFGMIPSGTVLFNQTAVCSASGDAAIDLIELIVGVTYTVEIDGTVYTSVASAEGDATLLLCGDYMIGTVSGMSIFMGPEGEHAVKIALAEDAVKKIDEKYLPDGVGSGSALPEVTTDDNDKVLKVVDGVWAVADEKEETKELPTVSISDNGKFLQVVDGVWAAVALTDVSQEGA